MEISKLHIKALMEYSRIPTVFPPILPEENPDRISSAPNSRAGLMILISPIQNSCFPTGYGDVPNLWENPQTVDIGEIHPAPLPEVRGVRNSPNVFFRQHRRKSCLKYFVSHKDF